MSDTDQDTNLNNTPVMDDNIQVTPTTDSDITDSENLEVDIPMPEISDQNEVVESNEAPMSNDQENVIQSEVEGSIDTNNGEAERVDEGEEEVKEDTPEKVKEADQAELATVSDDQEDVIASDNEAISDHQPANEEVLTDDSTDNVLSQNTNPESAKGRWYVVHTFSGHENRVATTLKQRIESEHLENKIFDILVPTQDKIEIKSGKKETVKEKIFPGYILIKMILDDASWLAVRTTQGVTAFIGTMNKPTPISEREVAGIVKFMNQGAAPTFKDVFMVDDTVKIVDGPFAEFIGKVDSVDKEKGRVRVLVSIFGRETPVELDFLQVQKL